MQLVTQQADIDEKVCYLPDILLVKYDLPERFTFPFCYDPHPLTLYAATDLQHYLTQEAMLDHNFGLDKETRISSSVQNTSSLSTTAASAEGIVIGKMFGVLLIQDSMGKVGYLSAFSGKLAGTNAHPRFVPPVFDMLTEESFFLRGQAIVNELNAEIERLEQEQAFLSAKQQLLQLEEAAEKELGELKASMRERKAMRDVQRRNQSESEALLIQESLYDKRILKDVTAQWKQRILAADTAVEAYVSRIALLKSERKERSAAIQQQLFEQYSFLNQYGISKSLQEIFSASVLGQPPSAAGECATPKLLQYAFMKGYKPLAMAEFWWGASPKSEIRKHGQFYPACTGKCKPILAHMLEDIPVDDNPLQQVFSRSGPLERVFEDDSLVLINKPSGLRSVPGVEVMDSVYFRLKVELNGIDPLVVHRLDMDTSGLLLFAKTATAHRHLQKQFLRKTVHKRYVALLPGSLDQTSGIIELPLAADPFDRPRQMVCFDTGKHSVSEWEVLEQTAEHTRVEFRPLTGRTHQLRVHAAHPLGLGAPILGDDLYGTPAERLFLHAASISFTHPLTKERLSFDVPVPF